jgi:hypothetical protein
MPPGPCGKFQRVPVLKMPQLHAQARASWVRERKKADNRSASREVWKRDFIGK